MKIIPKLEKGEKLNYKGDVTIEADVGEDAEISIEDGQLKINGNVHGGAKIRVVISEETRTRMYRSNSSGFTMFNDVIATHTSSFSFAENAMLLS